MSELDVEIILAFADNNMNTSQTAQSLFMHRNTVVYHIENIKKLTGLDPTNFYNLCSLVQMAKEGRIING